MFVSRLGLSLTDIHHACNVVSYWGFPCCSSSSPDFVCTIGKVLKAHIALDSSNSNTPIDNNNPIPSPGGNTDKDSNDHTAGLSSS